MSTTKKRGAAVVGAALLAIGALTGCGSSSSADADSGPVKVGVVVINAGSYASISAGVYTAAEISAKEFGTSDRPIQVVKIETDGTPANTLQAVTKAAQQEDVHYVTGFITSDMAPVLAQQAARLNYVVLNSVAQDEITKQTCVPNFFQIAATSAQYMLATKNLLATLPGIKTWDAIGPDYTKGHLQVSEFADLVQQSGGTVETEQFPAFGATEFGPQISALAAKPADALFSAVAGADAISFAKQAEAFGLFKKYKYLVGMAMVLQPLLEPFGSSANGFYDIVTYLPNQADNGNPAFESAYSKEAKETGWSVPAAVNTSFNLISAAAEKAKSSDPTKVAAAMSGLSINSVQGKVTIRPSDHTLEQSLISVQDVGGKFKVVKTWSPNQVTTPPSSTCDLS